MRPLTVERCDRLIADIEQFVRDATHANRFQPGVVSKADLRLMASKLDFVQRIRADLLAKKAVRS